MPKCDFNKVTKLFFLKAHFRHAHSPVTLLHIFRTPFCKNTYGGLLLETEITRIKALRMLK